MPFVVACPWRRSPSPSALPGADIEMANSLANVLTANGDVASEMAALKAKLQTIYDNEVAPNI